MYTNVRIYRVAPDEVDRIMHAVDETFVPQLSDEPGFVAYQAIDTGDGTLVTVTTCRDEDDAARSAERAKEFIQSELPDVDLERLGMHNGSVVVSKAVEEALEAAHA